MIAILAPYTHTEVTTAAIRLGEFFHSIGIEIKYVCCGPRADNVHPEWDHRVRSVFTDGVPKAVHGATHVVHFHHSDFWYSQATLSRKIRQIIVPTVGTLTRSDMFKDTANTIVCPTSSGYKFFKSFVTTELNDAGRPRVYWTPWDSGLPSVRREGTVADAKLKVCVVCDSATVNYCPILCLDVVRAAIQCNDRVYASLLCTKTWPKPDARLLKTLVNETDGKVTVQRITKQSSFVEAFHMHDWAIFPGVRADFGSIAALALSCGTPLIVNDIDPYSTLVRADHGMKVPCDLRSYSQYGSVAVPRLGDWLFVCENALSSTTPLYSLQRNAWKLQERQAMFVRTWTKILGL